ncbi:hypothetical protein K8R04_04505 [Candidatus Uhrbacteria bacterium]|nr:hypothetical protein [Candidatus Uhrbacteria bacterium]
MKNKSFGSQERMSTREAIDRKDMEARIEEAAIPEMEVMTADEMREQMIAKMRDLSSKIFAEEAIARDIHKMGAEVNGSTRDRINALDQKQKALIALHKKTLAPLFKENFVAIGRGEELLVPKPEEWDSLMSDDEYVLELGPAMQKRKSSIELETKEAQLREEAKQTEKMIDTLIDEVHAQPFFTNQDMAEHFLTTESRKIAEAHIGDLYKTLRKTSEQIRDIELNLGMVRRLEG